MTLTLVGEYTLTGESSELSEGLLTLKAPPRPVSTACRVHARFFLPLPERTARTTRERMLTGMRRPAGEYMPALLQLLLAMLRATGVIRHDRFVVEAIIELHYALDPRTEIRVFTL